METDKNLDYFEVEIDKLVIHEYVYKFTPSMQDSEFEYFVEDIRSNGQLEPIKLWRKAGTLFVIDGRNRINALKQIGSKTVKAKYYNIKTLEDLKIKILSWNNRRNTSKTEKAILAYLHLLDNPELKSKEVAQMFSVDSGYVSKVKYIHNAIGLDILKKYLDTRVFEYGSKRFTSIANLSTYIKNKEKEKVVNDMTREKKSQLKEKYAEFGSEFYRIINELVDMERTDILGEMDNAVRNAIGKIITSQKE
jgi:ParB family chromosome partitioning protein